MEFKKKEVKIKCHNKREVESVKQVLREIYQWSDEKIEKLLNLMPNEVQDVRDAVGRSVF